MPRGHVDRAEPNALDRPGRDVGRAELEPFEAARGLNGAELDALDLACDEVQAAGELEALEVRAYEARPHRGVWTRYGKALLDALRKDIPVSQTAVLRALENATLVEDGDFARGYAFALLGDAFGAIADQSDPEMTEPLITTLESAVKAYEQSLKLHDDKNTKERLAATKKRLKALR